ncbi:alpha-L-rhamnosidase-related protein [Coraliomargarita sp. W4R53]
MNKQTFNFQKARPIWESSLPREAELDTHRLFVLSLSKPISVNSTLSIACCDWYRVWIEDQIIAQGPARSAPNFARVDQWPLKPGIINSTFPRLLIEVTHSIRPRFDRICDHAFLSAELTVGGEVIAATGHSGNWALYDTRWLRSGGEKFSMQRGSIEAWQFTSPDSYNFNANVAITCHELETRVLKSTLHPQFIKRTSPLPALTQVATRISAHGTWTTEKKALYNFDYWWKAPDVSAKLGDLKPAEWSNNLIDAIGHTRLAEADIEAEPPKLNKGHFLNTGKWLRFDFERNLSGFPELDVVCHKPSRLRITFDEVLTNGKIDPSRNKSHPVVHWELCEGRHHLRPMEPYTMRFAELIVESGELTIASAHFTQMIYGGQISKVERGDAFATIRTAARHTFEQNTVDIYMDCPGRERAGWLCDSFFMARAEAHLTGNSQVEEDFIENFILTESFLGIPDGLVPMCWPSDNCIEQFIPQWALWYILQLCETPKRHGTDELLKRGKVQVYKIFEWFAHYKNEDGLLENLPGWNFIEWSKANDLTDGVNFPTQFIYAAALDTAGIFYKNPTWRRSAQSIRHRAVELSFNGKYFQDHARRDPDGQLVVCPECTETAQYYAFFFEAISPNEQPELWTHLIQLAGKIGKQSEEATSLFPSNAFIGNLLRFDLLKRYGAIEQLHQEIASYYGYMAEITGTLWEHDTPEASCNHGFAAYLACLIET